MKHATDVPVGVWRAVDASTANPDVRNVSVSANPLHPLPETIFAQAYMPNRPQPPKTAWQIPVAPLRLLLCTVGYFWLLSAFSSAWVLPGNVAYTLVAFPLSVTGLVLTSAGLVASFRNRHDHSTMVTWSRRALPLPPIFLMATFPLADKPGATPTTTLTLIVFVATLLGLGLVAVGASRIVKREKNAFPANFVASAEVVAEMYHRCTRIPRWWGLPESACRGGTVYQVTKNLSDLYSPHPQTFVFHNVNIPGGSTTIDHVVCMGGHVFCVKDLLGEGIRGETFTVECDTGGVAVNGGGHEFAETVHILNGYLHQLTSHFEVSGVFVAPKGAKVQQYGGESGGILYAAAKVDDVRSLLATKAYKEFTIHPGLVLSLFAVIAPDKYWSANQVASFTVTSPKVSPGEVPPTESTTPTTQLGDTEINNMWLRSVNDFEKQFER